MRGLASGVLGDLVADEVYLYFMEIHLDQGSAKKLSGQETASLSPQTNSQLQLDILHFFVFCKLLQILEKSVEGIP